MDRYLHITIEGQAESFAKLPKIEPATIRAAKKPE